jgi:hypothetical protein
MSDHGREMACFCCLVTALLLSSWILSSWLRDTLYRLHLTPKSGVLLRGVTSSNFHFSCTHITVPIEGNSNRHVPYFLAIVAS